MLAAGRVHRREGTKDDEGGQRGEEEKGEAGPCRRVEKEPSGKGEEGGETRRGKDKGGSPGSRRKIEDRGLRGDEGTREDSRKERAREKRRIGGRGGMRHKGAMGKEKIGEGMRVLNGRGEGGGGEHLTSVPDRVTSLLPFPPTWYNVLESPCLLRRRGTTGQKGRRCPCAAVFETSSPSIE